MNDSSPTAAAPAPSHYLVLDLEATCCDQGTIPCEETEIIEIGAVMVDAATLRPVDEFTSFVRPVRYPQLTPFCTELTRITQEHLIGAPLIADALAELRRWAERYPGHVFCSWGDYDRNQIQRECETNGLPYPFTSGHINLKKRFSEQLGVTKRFGMDGALRKIGLPLTETHHRGIDDARNIARLLPHAVGTRLGP